MCTVTFIPTGKYIHLTSNRDEHPNRSRAISPKKYPLGDGELLYPKDKDGGGSWIGVKNNGDAAVLLNGAFTRHSRQPSYRKSRGLLFVEIMKAYNPPARFSEIDLSGIEPFTLVIFSGGGLHECRWDGSLKYRLALDAASPHIWSSATLYDEAMTNKRKKWFEAWRNTTGDITTEDILSFHRHAGTGDMHEDLVMDRPGKASTVSITSIRVSDAKASAIYLDLQENRRYRESLSLKSGPGQTPVSHLRKNFIGKAALSVKKFFVRTGSWEYWPFHMVYAPIYLYWFWLGLKAKSFFFFSAANPSIRNAGFLLEPKKEIYDLMPSGSYPDTVFCKAGISIEAIRLLMEERRLKGGKLLFPMIAKPDIGQRGAQVKLLQMEAELYDYALRSKVDFLLQEYISYAHEVGIFYYRIPGEEKGIISGIVGKELLAVRGDGFSTIDALLQKEDRFFLQLPVLREVYGEYLQTILDPGVVQTLVPYGNHSRGAKFTDLTHLVTDELTDTIDALCRQIPDFYFGRLDIKYDNWEALCAGRNFSVIELNGAGSEPTHIYDPAHSIFFAWKEIIRHWRLLYKISLLNARKKGLSLMGTRAGLKMLRDNANYLKLLS